MPTIVLVRFAAALVAVVILAALPAGASGRQLENGVTPADLERGEQAFLSACASCHGTSGDAVANVTLTAGTYRRATTDQELMNLIRSGIPGTAMPPSSLSEAQAALVVAYLRSLRAPTSAPRATGLVGSAAAGKAVYTAGDCASCHRAGGQGGFLGPDLSSVGATRAVPELERALLDPSADIRTGNRTVTVVTKDGKSTVGRLLNQDTYSLQWIDAAGTLTSSRKDALRQWDVMAVSGMPNYTAKLSAQQLADVVAYLQTLNEPVQAGGIGGAGRGRGGPGAAPAPGGARGARGAVQ
jgi:putative heme-binding domain-containing protein